MSSAFSGEGARLFGGRWNSKGRAVCYLADSSALCQLEVLANTRDPRQLQSKMLFRACFDERHVETLEHGALPDGWDARPPGAPSQRVGDEWIAEGCSLVLRVPSVLDPYGATYLLNPGHSDFADVVRMSYPFDQRLAKWNES